MLANILVEYLLAFEYCHIYVIQEYIVYILCFLYLIVRYI